MLKSIPARIVFWQFIVGVAGAVVAGLLAGPKMALGAFVGGAIGAILSLYFAIKVFGGRQGTDPGSVVRGFFRGEASKLLLAAVIFSLVAIYLADVWIPLIITFAASQAVYGFALIWKAGDGY